MLPHIYFQKAMSFQNRIFNILSLFPSPLWPPYIQCYAIRWEQFFTDMSSRTALTWHPGMRKANILQQIYKEQK